MVRSTIVGLVVVVLIAKAATSLRVVLPNRAERTEVTTFGPEKTKNFDVRAENGSVEIVGQDDATADIVVTSVLQASAKDEESAAAALEAMEVTIDNKELDGKDSDTCHVGWRWKKKAHEDWSGSVAFHIVAPQRVNVACVAQNGSISVDNLKGTAKLKSQNGKIVSKTSGDSLEARSGNGDIEAKYSGPRLQLHVQNGAIAADVSHAKVIDGDITTQNGKVALVVGDHTSCKLSASTVNGRVTSPGQKRSWMKRFRKSHSVQEVLGAGEGTLKVAVQNGAIKIKQVTSYDDADADSDDEDSDE